MLKPTVHQPKWCQTKSPDQLYDWQLNREPVAYGAPTNLITEFQGIIQDWYRDAYNCFVLFH